MSFSKFSISFDNATYDISFLVNTCLKIQKARGVPEAAQYDKMAGRIMSISKQSPLWKKANKTLNYWTNSGFVKGEYWHAGILSWYPITIWISQSAELERLVQEELGIKIKVQDPVSEHPWPGTKIDPLLGTLAGFIIPYLRKKLVLHYVSREMDKVDGYGLLVSSSLGFVYLDSLHPLVYPLRLFGGFAITEPIRTAIGFRSEKKTK